MKELIFDLQNEIIKLLKSYNQDLPLSLLSQDNCSELSRLAGCWIMKKDPSARVSIFKGTGIRIGKNRSHDLLIVNKNDRIYILDVAIWQFYKTQKSIYIKQAGNLADIMIFLRKKYGGEWSISENITKNHCKNINTWKKVIKHNISSI
jgi:hypothetical protein